MTSFRNLFTTTLLLGSVISAPLAAQSLPTTAALATDSSQNVAAASGLAGPRLGATTTGIRHQVQPASELAHTQPISVGKPVALMVVGGAAFVLGAVIGQEIGTLFMVGGAISFIIGLYQYIR
ncbi:MAG TPA: hypothetical protein VF483_01725 [Gemmatimonadaceae bacterium]